MNKKLLGLLSIIVLLLTGCNQNDDKTIVVGATGVPHAEILEVAKPLVEAAGYELDIQIFDDYILPNKALANGDLDANYFQHVPYLNAQIDEFGYDFVNAANIHVEPINIYSKKFSDTSEITKGSTVYISNSVSDQARILALLDSEGLITLDDSVDKTIATFDDIAENPLDLQFEYDFDPSLLPKIYENNEGDLVAINTNFALANDLDNSEAIIKESPDSEYPNALVVRSEDKDSEKTKVLVDALTSDEIKEFINTTYEGAVIPASN